MPIPRSMPAVTRSARSRTFCLHSLTYTLSSVLPMIWSGSWTVSGHPAEVHAPVDTLFR